MNSTNTTRRAVLAGTAALVPAAALAAPILGELHPDAALFELGRKLKLAVKDRDRTSAAFDAMARIRDQRTEAKATWPANQDDWSPDDASAYVAAVSEEEKRLGPPI